MKKKQVQQTRIFSILISKSQKLSIHCNKVTLQEFKMILWVALKRHFVIGLPRHENWTLSIRNDSRTQSSTKSISSGNVVAIPRRRTPHSRNSVTDIWKVQEQFQSLNTAIIIHEFHVIQQNHIEQHHTLFFSQKILSIYLYHLNYITPSPQIALLRVL